MCLLTVNNAMEQAEDVKNRVEEKITWFEKQIPHIQAFGWKLLIAILIIFIGRKLIRWIDKLLVKFFHRSSIDEGISKFLLSLSNVIMNLVVLLFAASKLGLESTSLVALVGSAGLTVGLALQGSLSNFSGGVLILLMKPFRIGDYIVTKENEGTVSSIDIFYTKLLTVDNRLVVIPNGALSNSNIINVTNEPIRRLDIDVAVDYSENIKKVKDLLYNLGSSHELVHKDKDIQVYVISFDPSAIKISLRIWVDTENYWKLKFDMLEQIKSAFDQQNIVIPYDQLDINLNGKTD